MIKVGKPLAECLGRRSRSCRGNKLHLARTTSSGQSFPWFSIFWRGTNSWWGTKNVVKCGYLWWENASILRSYVFSLYFVLLIAYEGQKTKNLMWLRMSGEVTSIYIYLYVCVYSAYICIECREEARLSVKRGYVRREKSYISPSVMYLAYILLH